MKYWRIVIVIAIMVIMTACTQSTNEKAYYKIQKKFNTIESYQCIAKIKGSNGETTREYIFQQTFKSPNLYRLEGISPQIIKGNLIIYNGRTAWFRQASINQVYKIDNFNQSQEQIMFIGYFLQNHINSKLPRDQVNWQNSSQDIVLEAIIPGGNPYFAYQRLWINKKTKKPEKLYIYDERDRVVFKIFYQAFEYNLQLDDDIFNLSDLS